MSGRSLQPVEKSTGTPFDIVTYLEQATFLQQQPSCHPSHLTAYSQPYNDDEGFRRFLSQKVSCAEEFLRGLILVCRDNRRAEGEAEAAEGDLPRAEGQAQRSAAPAEGGAGGHEGEGLQARGRVDEGKCKAAGTKRP